MTRLENPQFGAVSVSSRAIALETGFLHGSQASRIMVEDNGRASRETAQLCSYAKTRPYWSCFFFGLTSPYVSPFVSRVFKISPSESCISYSMMTILYFASMIVARCVLTHISRSPFRRRYYCSLVDGASTLTH